MFRKSKKEYARGYEQAVNDVLAILSSEYSDYKKICEEGSTQYIMGKRDSLKAVRSEIEKLIK